MKRVIIILLLMCYLMSAIGMTVSAHYCGGKLASVSLQLLATEKCKCGNKKMKKDCCKTTTYTFKIQTDQQQSVALEVDFNKAFSVQPAIVHTICNTVFSASVEKEFYNHHPPPLQSKQPLYLLNGVFRI